MNPKSSPTSSTAWHPDPIEAREQRREMRRAGMRAVARQFSSPAVTGEVAMTSRTAKDVAITYVAAGLSVIPIRWRDKRPLLAWAEFEARHPTEAEVLAWFRRWPDAGVAIICGTISGLAVVDCDPRNGDGPQALARRLPPTPTAETGGGGRHYYFVVHGERIPKIPALLPGVDLQAHASYVIAPPSVHPSGRPYRWLPGLALGEIVLAPLPSIIRQLIALYRRPEEKEQPARLSGLVNRNFRDENSVLTRSTRSLDAVLSALQGVRRCGRGWVARCPAHEDREPSLSIGEAGGKLLLHCFAGCSFEEILSMLRGRR